MSTPSAAGKEAHHVEHKEHLSIWPLVLGFAALFMYLGVIYIGPLTLVGVVLLLFAFLGWIREDVKLWPHGGIDHGTGILPKDGGFWGMVFFLATEVMLFGSLFATYFAQRGNYPEVWAEARDIITHSLGLVTINTVILLSSGATLHYGVHSIKKGNRKGLVIGFVLSMILGAIFLAVQAKEYATFISEGMTLSSSVFGSIFYLLTGTHGFHVLLGVIMLGIIAVRGMMGHFTAESHTAVDAFALYWHFVDVVWILVYLIIYVGVI